MDGIDHKMGRPTPTFAKVSTAVKTTIQIGRQEMGPLI